MKVAQDKSQIVAKLPEACSDEGKAVEFMEAQRWGDRPFCPHCGVVGESAQIGDRETGERNRRFLWLCRACKRQFTVRIGTVFEDSRIPLRHWCYAFWKACSSKKGVSALQIKRETGLSYKSALFMMHRIRYAMADEAPRPLGEGGGTVEVDEAYLGGKPRRANENLAGWRALKPGQPGPARPRSTRGRGTDKEMVMAMVERGGEIRPFHMPKVSAPTLKDVVRNHVHSSARIVTDELSAYRGLDKEFEGGHETVTHSVGEYVRGDVYTNTCEGFFSLLKRGMHGTFHSVSVKHLHRYLSEFQFRYNARKVDDGERVVRAIQKADGKRLMYRDQTR
jgi:transposase-like protein